MKLYLVACAAKKAPFPCEARELYQSNWFRYARALAEMDGDAWFILSAKHGLLRPRVLTAPYDECLSNKFFAARQAWGARVIEQMNRYLPDARECVVLAGGDYRDQLMPYLEARYPRVTVPMRGLTLGKQIQWVKSAAYAAGYSAPNPHAIANRAVACGT